MKDLIYPWSKAELSEEEVWVAEYKINPYMSLLGYPLRETISKPKSKVLLKAIDEIMDYLDPSNGGEGKWSIIVTNNKQWLNDMNLIIPITYTWTHKLQVHPIDPVGFFNIVKQFELKDVDENYPAGFNAFSKSSLIVFKNIHQKHSTVRRFMAVSEGIFEAWSDPKTSVIGLAFFPNLFTGDDLKKLVENIGFYYGENAQYTFTKRGKLFKAFDEQFPSIFGGGE